MSDSITVRSALLEANDRPSGEKARRTPDGVASKGVAIGPSQAREGDLAVLPARGQGPSIGREGEGDQAVAFALQEHLRRPGAEVRQQDRAVSPPWPSVKSGANARQLTCSSPPGRLHQRVSVAASRDGRCCPFWWRWPVSSDRGRTCRTDSWVCPFRSSSLPGGGIHRRGPQSVPAEARVRDRREGQALDETLAAPPGWP